MTNEIELECQDCETIMEVPTGTKNCLSCGSKRLRVYTISIEGLRHKTEEIFDVVMSIQEQMNDEILGLHEQAYKEAQYNDTRILALEVSLAHFEKTFYQFVRAHEYEDCDVLFEPAEDH